MKITINKSDNVEVIINVSSLDAYSINEMQDALSLALEQEGYPEYYINQLFNINQEPAQSCEPESDGRDYFSEELTERFKEDENPLKDYLSTLFRFSWTGQYSLWTIPSGTTNSVVEAIAEFAPESDVVFLDFALNKNKLVWSFPETGRGSVYIREVDTTFPNEGYYRFNLILTTDKPFKTQD